MSPEYEILWDGTHNNQDDDLLNHVAAIPEKRAPVFTKPDPATIVEAALPTRDRDGLTLRQLAAITGLSIHSVNNALYDLRHRGRLNTSHGRPLRAPQRYWRKGEL